jgi:hypothetical protein
MGSSPIAVEPSPPSPVEQLQAVKVETETIDKLTPGNYGRLNLLLAFLLPSIISFSSRLNHRIGIERGV